MSADTQSPRGPLAKLRRNNKGDLNTSTTSLASSSGEGDDSGGDKERKVENAGLRASVETAIGKVKDRTRRGSVDGQWDRRGSEESTRLSSLVARTKRKVRRGSIIPGGSRRGSVDTRLGNGLDLDDNQSESSLLAGSGRSSLLTDDERLDTNG
jgi:hypothetical protein